MEVKKYKAIKCIQNEKDFYLAFLPSDILAKTCFISRREDDPAKGFQRSLNESRSRDIAKYLDDTKGVIPSALILSAQKAARFSFEEKSSDITFIDNEKSFMVLDGQHRLYGLTLAKSLYSIPVVIFKELTSNQEVNLFIDINTNQKGVPATLLIDIKNLAGTETKKEEKQRDVFDRLNQDSVMAGLMSTSKGKVGKITRVSFNNATNYLFESGFLENKDSDTIYKSLKNYLEAVEKVFLESKSDRAKLNNTTLFRAVLAVFNEVIDKCLKKFGDLKVSSLVECLSPISKISFDAYSGSNNATYNRIISDMRAELNEHKNFYKNEVNSNIF